MEEVFLCPECITILKDPVELSCPHSFCLGCAKKVQKIGFLRNFGSKKLKQFFCPICDQVTKLSKTGEFELNTLLKKMCLKYQNMSDFDPNPILGHAQSATLFPRRQGIRATEKIPDNIFKLDLQNFVSSSKLLDLPIQRS